MLFNSFEFACFLPIVLLLYYALRREVQQQNLLLLVASYVFYGWWDWRFLILMFISTMVDYYCARGVAESPTEKLKKRYLYISIFANLSILAYFKYFNFFIDSFAVLLESLGFQANLPVLNIILPVGISFYTFQTMSYTIDVYKGRLKAVKNILDFALYVCFFPQLVAGPIERAETLLPQIAGARRVGLKDIQEGVVLILVGLFRKVVIADNAAPYVEKVFSYPQEYSFSGLLVGVILFAVQIYSDFAGYSSIARGTARLLGFNLMINFQQPYLSQNITEFWRRWHISLSTWLRDYLYIPLGGNRHGKWMTYRNLMLTMLIGGLWHGASWMFVIWGGLHGLYLGAHRIYTERFAPAEGKASSPFWKGLNFLWGVLLTNVLVSFAWIFFRAESMTAANEVISGILSLRGDLLETASPGKVLEPAFYLMLMLLFSTGIDVVQYRANSHTVFLRYSWWLQALIYAFMLVAITLFSGSGDIQFIYFQF